MKYLSWNGMEVMFNCFLANQCCVPFHEVILKHTLVKVVENIRGHACKDDSGWKINPEMWVNHAETFIFEQKIWSAGARPSFPHIHHSLQYTINISFPCSMQPDTVQGNWQYIQPKLGKLNEYFGQHKPSQLLHSQPAQEGSRGFSCTYRRAGTVC